jgi:hypothetical protein
MPDLLRIGGDRCTSQRQTVMQNNDRGLGGSAGQHPLPDPLSQTAVYQFQIGHLAPLI